MKISIQNMLRYAARLINLRTSATYVQLIYSKLQLATNLFACRCGKDTILLEELKKT